MRHASVFLAVLLLFLVPASADLLFYLAPDGNDQWTGKLARPNDARTDGPLATLSGARDAIRKVQPRNQPIRVVIAAGRYELPATFALEAQDSGAEQAPITYEAAPGGAKPVFTGGRQLPAFTPGPDGVWTASIPAVKEGKWYFEQLFIDGQRATRARTPNKLYQYAWRKVLKGVDPATGKEVDLSRRASAPRRRLQATAGHPQGQAPRCERHRLPRLGHVAHAHRVAR